MCFFHISAKAQLGYAKDSLQIKVYTQIEYKNYKAIKIISKKVFCDFCSDLQLKYLENEALRRTNLEVANPKYVSKNGKAKLALYIRVSKKDFAEIKDNKINNK
jgi:hypothetical protein